MRTPKRLVDYFPEWLTGDLFKQISELMADNPAWAWLHGNVSSLSVDYFGSHSGEKAPAPLVKKLATDDELSDEAKTQIANIIVNRFGKNWEKLAKIYDYQYNPLENYGTTETETPDITRTRMPDLTDTETPNITRTRTPELTHTETPDITITETPDVTTVTTGTENAGLYGFNSDIGVPSDNTISESTEKETGTRDRRETGTRTTVDTGTEQETETGSKTFTKTGTETETETGTKKIERAGNNGAVTYQELLRAEIDIWDWNFINKIYSDIDSVLALSVYL